ncbi:MAG: carbon-nitrogen hydrolase family protein [Saprospiraceae bacterium]|nr:carbon-nitrogen hydrolase family protein [Saprospiraceae bacterium]
MVSLAKVSRFSQQIITAILLAVGLCFTTVPTLAQPKLAWEQVVPQQALTPEFFSPKEHVLGIRTGEQKHLHGYWRTIVPVVGGKFYSFSIVEETANVTDDRCAAVQISWESRRGHAVLRDEEYGKRYAVETFPDGTEFAWTARPEIPYEKRTLANGKIERFASFQAPSIATNAEVQLHLRYCDQASIEWSRFSFKEIEEPPKQRIKVASIFLPPSESAKSQVDGKVEIFKPYIEEAAEAGARLVCLPEWFNKSYSSKSVEVIAEQIPGGISTTFLEGLANLHDLYIVAGIAECDVDTIYNTAVLIGPSGYIGKYRKAGLTLREANALGVTPGEHYPVFKTEIGRIGMMICYDIYFPEVAQNLSGNGADIIAMPIAGGHPILAQARAIENQVYLITSTYSQREEWIKTAIFDYDGKMLAFTDKPGSIAIAEIEISPLPKYWAHLGHLKADLRTQKPVDAKSIRAK